MNNDRRQRIAKAIEKLEEAKSDLEAIREEEDEAFNNLPESIQNGERGQAMTDAVDALDRIGDAIDEAIDAANEAAGG